MSDRNATHTKRVTTLKEHLAGVKGAQVFQQTLIANHLQHLSDVYNLAQQQVNTESDDNEVVT